MEEGMCQYKCFLGQRDLIRNYLNLQNDPLSTLMREMTGREVEMALADEKVQAIRPQLMSGEAMVTCISM